MFLKNKNVCVVLEGSPLLVEFFFVWKWFARRSKIACPLVGSSIPFVNLDRDVLLVDSF